MLPYRMYFELSCPTSRIVVRRSRGTHAWGRRNVEGRRRWIGCSRTSILDSFAVGRRFKGNGWGFHFLQTLSFRGTV